MSAPFGPSWRFDMPRPRTVSLLSDEERRAYNRSIQRKYDTDAESGYYTDEEVIEIRRQIWCDVFQDMSVEMGISPFNPNDMTFTDILSVLANKLTTEKR